MVNFQQQVAQLFLVLQKHLLKQIHSYLQHHSKKQLVFLTDAAIKGKRDEFLV